MKCVPVLRVIGPDVKIIANIILSAYKPEGWLEKNYLADH